jgi:hypothetical protein
LDGLVNDGKEVLSILIGHNGVCSTDSASSFSSVMFVKSDDVDRLCRTDVVETPSFAENHGVGPAIGSANVPSLLSCDVRVNAHIVIASGSGFGASHVR